MILKNLLSNIDCLTKGNLDIEITEIITDSRKVSENSLYIALGGTKTDGQNFIPDVIEKGCKAIFCEKIWLESNELNPKVTYIGVNNRQKDFSKISANFYSNPTENLTMIGVTGTNGKTTTTHLIENILKEAGNETGIIGTLYSRYAGKTITAKYTTPMADELQKTFYEMKEHKVDSVIMEVSSHALKQYRVGSCNYKVAVFTNLTQDHLDYHPTFDDYRESKGILFSELSDENSFSVINVDNPSAGYYSEISQGKVLTYGINNKADIFATNIDLKMDSTSFTLNTPKGSLELNLRLVGKFNVYNCLSAIATAYALGISLEKCKIALEKTSGIAGRIEIVTPKGHPFTVVVDYAHTPDSLENILKSSREFTKNNLICVFGCGGDRDRTKRPIMGGIANRLSDIPVVTSDNPRTEDPDFIISQILEGMPNKENIIVEVDRKNAIKKAIESAKEGDTVVIAGKGHEDYQIFKDKTIHFDDREVAREFIIN
ncbi:MAG: UDP-N-acetylmuramoyl-L-alanyl-D-glutamate--2,6-diaminopimelate ligase [Candidatus Sericytochromatia bacterium]